jgi:hypothetical protein
MNAIFVGPGSGPGNPPQYQPGNRPRRGRDARFSILLGSHTNSLLPVYLKGAVPDLGRFTIGVDPRRGEYLDNTAVARMIFELLDSEERDNNSEVD